MSAPLVWLLRDHADERELVMNEGDDEVRAAYDDEEEVYEQEADRLLEKHAQALVHELASPSNDPNNNNPVGHVLRNPPEAAKEAVGFNVQENWAQLREHYATTRPGGPCATYLLNRAPMQKAGVRAAKLSQVCRALHRLFAERSANAHRAHLRRKDACYAAAQTIVASSRQDWLWDCYRNLDTDITTLPRSMRPRTPMKRTHGRASAVARPQENGTIKFDAPRDAVDGWDGRPVPYYGVDVLQLHLSNICASTTRRTERVIMHKYTRRHSAVAVSEKMTVETVQIAFDVELARDEMAAWLPSVWPGTNPPHLLRGCAPELDDSKHFLGRTIDSGPLLTAPLVCSQFDTSLIGSLRLPWGNGGAWLESSAFVLDYTRLQPGSYDRLVVEEAMPVGWNLDTDYGQRKPSKLLKLPTSIAVELVFCMRGGVRLKLKGIIADAPLPGIPTPNAVRANLQRRLLEDIPSGGWDLATEATNAMRPVGVPIHPVLEGGKAAARRVIDYARLPAEEKGLRLLKGVTVVWQDYGFDVPTPRPLGPAATAEEEEI